MKFINKLCVILSTIYIIWRLFTLPINLGVKSICFSIIFLIIEIIDYFEFIISYRNTISKINRDFVLNPKELKKYKDVDVIISTINEPETIIKRTLDCCSKIDYPKRKIHIFVADDGNREKIKKLTESYDFNYISRNNHRYAKAGNLNNAIKQTESDYILFLDCDMAPTRDILNIMMPYFEIYDNNEKNSKIGFVQGPQNFVNTDIFQKTFKLKDKIPNDQNYFFNILQSTNNEINAVVLCGTNVIVKREALEKIGGIVTDSISEDFATGMLIENEGYNAIYVNKAVAYGYQENSLSGYISQRTRWQRGCIQTGKKHKVLKQKELNLNQKLEYLVAINYWNFGIKRLFFLIAPIMYCLFGIYLINCDVKSLLIFWLPQYIIRRYLLDINYTGNSSSTWNKIYQITFMPIFLVTSISEYFGKKKQKFEVSTKNIKADVKKDLMYNNFLFITHLIFFILNFIAYSYAIFNVFNNIFEMLTIWWSLSNLFYLIIALIFDVSIDGNSKAENDAKTNQYSKFAILDLFKRFFLGFNK